MSTPLVSIIIPCFNQGIYLKDALDSLRNCPEDLYEVIIVNDGSTDEYTNQYLVNLAEQGYDIIFQENAGLGQARNNGIKKAKGEYILPLDADNRIYPAYLTKGVKVLNEDETVAVVYGNSNYFGQKSGTLVQGPFILQRLMMGNFIDACSLIRKSVLEEVGYYDKMKIMGYEDWDLWLRIAFKDYKFFYIDEVLFDYRVTDNSMMKSVNRDISKQNEIEKYIFDKYYDKISFEYVDNYFIYKIKKKPFKFLYRLILKKYFHRYYEKLINGNKIYRGYLYD